MRAVSVIAFGLLYGRELLQIACLAARRAYANGRTMCMMVPLKVSRQSAG